jgi:CDP-diacylglycerol---serine O-phosphatidyltransferase
MRKIFLVPNVITAFGLACGIFVIFKVNMIEPGAGEYAVMKTSALLLLLAAFADFIDGAVARMLKAETEFGIMFDSLADAVSFGVAPSVVVLKSLSLQQGSVISFLTATGGMVYSLCGILRLVRYNVKKDKKSDSLIKSDVQEKNFTGLPIPAAAAGIISINLVLLSPIFEGYFNLSNTLRAIILTCVMGVLGYLMVCRWKFPGLKSLHFRVASFHLAFISVVIAVFVLYGAFYYFSIVLALMAWVYIIVAIVLSIIRIIAGKKSKTLEDFEPDPDEFEE